MVYMFPMGRHEVRRAPAFDPLMTVIVSALLMLLGLIWMLAGA
jgi:hypothetical protein